MDNIEVLKENIIKDVLKDYNKKRELKNKRSATVDSIVRIIADDVIDNVGFGVGIDPYGIFNAIDDREFVKGKSNTFTIHFGPVDNIKDVCNTAEDITNKAVTSIALWDLVTDINNTKGNTNVDYYRIRAIIYNKIKEGILDSNIYHKSMEKYKNSLKEYNRSNELSNFKQTCLEIANSNEKGSYNTCNIKTYMTDRSGYTIAVTITLY